MKHGVRYTMSNRHASARFNCFDVSMARTLIPSESETTGSERASASLSGVQEMRQEVIGDVYGNGWP